MMLGGTRPLVAGWGDPLPVFDPQCTGTPSNTQYLKIDPL